MAAPGSPRYIVVGIDGTSSSSWRRPDGSNSHVYKFVRDFQYGAIGVDRLFLDGPSDMISGRESEPILQKALDFITHRLSVLFPAAASRSNFKPLEMFDVNTCKQNQYYQHQYNGMGGPMYGQHVKVPVKVSPAMLASQPLTMDQVRIVLVGHSRGGLVATVLARMLAPLVPVYFLGLYDSVDRQPCLDGGLIENVKIVYHARRNPEVGSRGMFSNTSTRHRVEHYEESFFYTSHGGIGGDFVSDPNQSTFFGDKSCLIRPDTRTVVTRGGAVTVDNRHPLTKKFNRPIQQICAEGRDASDQFIRAGAKRYGLPVN